MTDKQILFWAECIEKNREDFNNEKKLLTDKFGGAPHDEDVIWSLLNKQLLYIPPNDINLFSKLITIYDLMTHFLLKVENKDPIDLIKQKQKVELNKIKAAEIYTKVKVGTQHDGVCSTAKKMKNRVFNLDDAIAQMPIPFPDCRNRQFHKKIKVCTCYYIPLTDDET
jgi:hypothetical protein